MSEEWKGEMVIDLDMLSLTLAIRAVPPLTMEQVDEIIQYLAEKYNVAIEGEEDG